MRSYIPSIFVLGIALIIAFMFTKKRNPSLENQAERNSAAKVLSFTIIVQCIHFIEEAMTGFNLKLGELLGIPAMSFGFFLIFNLVWIGIWIYSIFGLRSGNGFSFFAAWFLSIAGVLNGIIHPLLSLMAGKYFPGTISSSFVAIASIWLWHKLNTVTSLSKNVKL
jgi:Protein of unknown function with HXXEE motif